MRMHDIESPRAESVKSCEIKLGTTYLVAWDERELCIAPVVVLQRNSLCTNPELALLRSSYKWQSTNVFCTTRCDIKVHAFIHAPNTLDT